MSDDYRTRPASRTSSKPPTHARREGPAMSNQHPYDRSMEKTREVNRMRGLLREAADLIRSRHIDCYGSCEQCCDHWAHPDDFPGDWPCRWEQLRRRIEEAL